MAVKGLNVKELSEIKRLLNLGLTNRQIARALKIHRNTINKYVEKIKSNVLEDENKIPVASSHWSAHVDWENVRREFLSGVPLNIIYEELFELQKLSVQYPGFWKQAHKNINLSVATMVKIHRPGERAEIDYCDGIDILDPATGEVRRTHLFVGVLCHSRFAFAEQDQNRRNSNDSLFEFVHTKCTNFRSQKLKNHFLGWFKMACALTNCANFLEVPNI